MYWVIWKIIRFSVPGYQFGGSDGQRQLVCLHWVSAKGVRKSNETSFEHNPAVEDKKNALTLICIPNLCYIWLTLVKAEPKLLSWHPSLNGQWHAEHQIIQMFLLDRFKLWQECQLTVKRNATKFRFLYCSYFLLLIQHSVSKCTHLSWQKWTKTILADGRLNYFSSAQLCFVFC